MKLHLVSFKTCPYVQRSVITLREKGIDFDITYIDLADPPAWFKADSPLGKVPILKTDQGVLFESAVINEYVDEVTEGDLMPTDPWQKGITRAWVEFGGQCLADYYQASMAPTEEAHVGLVADLNDKLGRLQAQIVGPFFFGETFTLADAALAPLMMRLEEFEKMTPHFDFAAFPELQAYKDRLAARDSVQGSIVPEWRELHADYIAQSGSHVAGLMAATAA
ncbi:MAG: glutathione S-transferase family protein [Thermoplasmatota archaeon]